MKAADKRDKARRQWLALQNVTVDRGATKPEAESAAKKARELDKKWHFGQEGEDIDRIVAGFDRFRTPGTHGSITVIIDGKTIQHRW